MHIKLKIIHFDFYVKRTDTKTLTWVAMPVDLLTQSDFFQISGEEFKAFFYIICLFIKDKKEVITIDVDHLCYMLHLNINDLKSCLMKLNNKKWEVIENTDILQIPYESVQVRTDLCPTNKHTNKKTNKEFTQSAQVQIDDESPSGLLEVVVKKNKIKKKVDKETLITFENFRPEQVVKDKWKQIYDMEYLSYQDKQMELWLLSNPEKDSKTQRGWTQFMTNWFARGWARWQEEHKPKVNINGFDPRLKLPENY